MKNEDILYALNGIREDFIEESVPIRRRPARRALTVALAAVLALLLMGAGFAGAIYGESIQAWMAQRWQDENGRTMGEAQTVLVDSMSQEIGLSQTIGGITVEADSAILGEQDFRVLFRVRGTGFTERDSIWFSDWDAEMDPDPTEGMGWCKGFEYAGIDADGTLLVFYHCNWDEAKRPEGPFTVRLSLTDLVRTGAGGVVEEVIQEGTWEFEFQMDITDVPESVTLPGCTVTVKDPKTGEKVDVELKSLVLCSTGLSYEKADPSSPDVGIEIAVVLTDGSSIGATMGMGGTHWWDVPVDPAEVTAIRICGTTINLP